MTDHITIGNNQNLFFLENNAVTFLPDGQKILDKMIDLMRLTFKKNGFLLVSSSRSSNPDFYDNIYKRIVTGEHNLPCKLFEISKKFNISEMKDLANLDENTALSGSIYCLPKIESMDIEFGNLLSVLKLFEKATGLVFKFEFKQSDPSNEIYKMITKHIKGEESDIEGLINIHVYNEVTNNKYPIGHIRFITGNSYIIRFVLINSFEALFVPLLEQKKKLPFILNINQINIIPIKETLDAPAYKYIQNLQDYFSMFSFNIDIRKGDFVAKVNDSENYEYVFIVGKKEVNTNTISYYHKNKSYFRRSPLEVRNMLLKEYFNFLE